MARGISFAQIRSNISALQQYYWIPDSLFGCCCCCQFFFLYGNRFKCNSLLSLSHSLLAFLFSFFGKKSNRLFDGIKQERSLHFEYLRADAVVRSHMGWECVRKWQKIKSYQKRKYKHKTKQKKNHVRTKSTATILYTTITIETRELRALHSFRCCEARLASTCSNAFQWFAHQTLKTRLRATERERER